MAKSVTKDDAVQPQQTVEQKQEINAGIEPAGKGTYKVVQQFRDVADFSKVHEIGDDVSSLDKTRLAELVEGGLVEKK